ncbi:MAG TPA: hypothetical protein VN676_08550 [Steroidobacteraceae bacterium]|jgi:hypothetical protein|nr:hypothetical protein [Steroidobacteraceae bacterium]
MEHRCGMRYPIDVGVYARSLHGVVSSIGQLREVSISGGFVRTTLPIRALAYVSLEILVGGRPSIDGQVVRCLPEGIAVEWSEYSPWIVQLLADRTPAPPSPALLLARSPLKVASGNEPLQWQDAPDPLAR